MSLWRHRDLVDVDNNNNKKTKVRVVPKQERTRRESRDKSNDSDRTINNNPKENGIIEKQKPSIKSNKAVKQSKSFTEKQKLSLAPRKESTEDTIRYEETYRTPMKPDKFDDQFYDDDGDGLMLKLSTEKTSFNNTPTIHLARSLNQTLI
ncbi:hypothetical protein JTB14_027629 [Gonioctena quinquepunctata]|nr:hypothetical protein JTB14_027629 [Gonioctena quinquepunctata]